jgi:hypothetical protein
MVFHLFLKLHEQRYDSYSQAQAPLVSEAYSGTRHDHLTVGIGCGPSGNNCSVEGLGSRGPGLMPLPGEIRAKFLGSHRIRGSHGSLFDLTAARKTLGASTGDNVSGVLHAHALGFGSSAYTAAQTPAFALSAVHVPDSSASGGSRNDAHHSSFFGRPMKPKPTIDVSEAWGRRSYSVTSQSGSAAQFSSVASMVPQSSGSSFHMKFSHGVVDPTSVEVRGGNSSSSVGLGRWSWNSGKLMDKDYNLLVKPKHVDVSQSWGKRVIDGQFSSASMLPQSTNSTFHFRTRHGVVDMSSVFASGDGHSTRRHGTQAFDTAAAGHSHYNDGFYAVLGAGIVGGVSVSAGLSGSIGRDGYSWSTSRNRAGDSSGMGDWLIAPEAAQWLPEGIGTGI